MEVRFNRRATYGKAGGLGEHGWRDVDIPSCSLESRVEAKALTALSAEVEGPCVILKSEPEGLLILGSGVAPNLDSGGRFHYVADVAYTATPIIARDLPRLIDGLIEVKEKGQAFPRQMQLPELEVRGGAESPWPIVLKRLLNQSVISVRNPILVGEAIQILGFEAFDWFGYFNNKAPRRFPTGYGLVLGPLGQSLVGSDYEQRYAEFLTFAADNPNSPLFKLLIATDDTQRKIGVDIIAGQPVGSELLEQLNWELRKAFLKNGIARDSIMQTMPHDQVEMWIQSEEFSLDDVQSLRQTCREAVADKLFERLTKLDERGFGGLRTFDAFLANWLTADRIENLLPDKAKLTWNQLSLNEAKVLSDVKELLSQLASLNAFDKVPVTIIANANRIGCEAANSRIRQILKNASIPEKSIRFLLDGDQSYEAVELPVDVPPELATAFPPESLLNGYGRIVDRDRSRWLNLIRLSFAKGAITADQICSFARINCLPELVELCGGPKYLSVMLTPNTDVYLPPLREEDWGPQCTKLLEDEVAKLVSCAQGTGENFDWMKDSILISRLCEIEVADRSLDWRDSLLGWMTEKGVNSEMLPGIEWIRRLLIKSGDDPISARKLRLIQRLSTRSEVLQQIVLWSRRTPSNDRRDALSHLCNHRKLTAKEQFWLTTSLLEWNETGTFPDTFSSADLCKIIEIEGIDPMVLLRHCLARPKEDINSELIGKLTHKLQGRLPPSGPLPEPIKLKHAVLIDALSKLRGWESVAPKGRSE